MCDIYEYGYMELQYRKGQAHLECLRELKRDPGTLRMRRVYCSKLVIKARPKKKKKKPGSITL